MRNGGKIEWRYQVNIRVIFRGQNGSIGEFKMAAGDVVSIREYVMKYACIPTKLKWSL